MVRFLWICCWPLLLVSCGGGAPLLGPPPCDLKPGEVLFVAVAPTPEADGEEALWLENVGARPAGLHRAVVSLQGGGEPRRWSLGEVSLAPGARLLLDAERLPGMGLADDGGEAVLRCGGEVIHRLRWAASDKGVVWVRDRAAPPAVVDEADWWCRAEDAEPRVCGLAFCLDAAGRARPVRPLSRFAITEVLADPQGRDEGREWLELSAAATGDWNGLRLQFTDARERRREWRLANRRCLAATLGERLVVGLGDGEGGIRAEGSGLPNGGGLLWAGNGEGSDEVMLPPAITGVAWARDSSEGGWCAAREPTPGEANPPCGPACREGGGWRPLRPPAAGELWLSEVLADPDGPDDGREWLELRSRGGTAIDLNAVELVARNSESGRERRWDVVQGEDCRTLDPGEAVVLAGDEVALPPGVRRFPVDLTLYNTALGLRLEYGGLIIDAAELPAAETGRALGVPWGPTAFADNDSASAWCGQRSATEAGNGTPGTLNDPCGAWCREGDQWRPWRSPAPGEVALSALHQGETDWVAVSALAGEVDLNGLHLVQVHPQGYRREWVLNAARCLVASPGVPLQLSATEPAVDLYLGVSRLSLWLGEVQLDETEVRVSRGATMAVPALVSAEDNDALEAWCRLEGTVCGP